MIRNNLRSHRFHRTTTVYPNQSRLLKIQASATPEDPTARIRHLVEEVKKHRANVENQLVRLYNAGHMTLDFSSVIGAGLFLTTDRNLQPWEMSAEDETPHSGVAMICAFKWRNKNQKPSYAKINLALRRSARGLLSAEKLYDLFKGPNGQNVWDSKMTSFMIESLTKEAQMLREIDEQLQPIGTAQTSRRASTSAKPTSSAQSEANAG